MIKGSLLRSPWADAAEFPGIMKVLVTRKNQKDHIKNEVTIVFKTFPHYNHMGDSCCH